MIRPEMLAAPLPRLAISLGGAGQACLLRKTSVEALTLPSPHDEAKLARDIVPICDDDPSDVRQAYRQFVPPVVELVNGEEVFEDFFHQYAYASFGSDDVQSGAAGKTLEKRNELESIMSYSVQDSIIKKLPQLAKKLFSLRRVIVHEFAQTNAEDVGENGTESGGLDSTSFNSTAIGGSVNLLWLKDQCNLITSSMLSGDKVAMALCRVLISNKSNDEIAGELLDLIDNASYEIPRDLLLAASDEKARQFLTMGDNSLDMLLLVVSDNNLAYDLQSFGLHHAGVNDRDRSHVSNNVIQVLAYTIALAWGVNLPAHLVTFQVVNPVFYGLEDTETYTLTSLSRLGEITTEDLEDSGCIKLADNSSKCYLSYCTVSMLGSNTGPIILLQDNFNRELCEKILYSVYHHHIDGAHVKGNLLFQVNFSREIYNDGSICTDMCANRRWLFPSDMCHLQMIMQYIECKMRRSHLCVLTDTLNKARAIKNISGDEILHGLLKVVAEGHNMLIEKKSISENHNEEPEHQVIEEEITKKLIFIDSMDGRLSVFVDMNHSCISLKKSIEEELGYSLENFTLRFGYKILENQKTLRSYGLSQFSVLDLYPKLLGGCEGDRTLAEFLGNGVQLVRTITIPHPYNPGRTQTVDNLTASGCRLAKSLVDIFIEAQRDGLSWDGLIGLNDFKVHRGRAEVTKPATRNHGTDGWIRDCKKLASILKIVFKAKGADPLYLSELLDTLEYVKREEVLFEWFRIYVQTHFAFTPSDNREKVSYQLMKMYESMSHAQQRAFENDVDGVPCHVWRSKLVQSAYIFKGTMMYRIKQCGNPYPITSFGCFKFQRNFTTHASEEKVNGIAKFLWNRLEYIVRVVLGGFVPSVIKTLLEKGYPIDEILTSSVPN